MEYQLRNGRIVTIRDPRMEDAGDIIGIMKIADAETKFLARDPGEFQTSVEREKEIIASVLNDTDASWFVAEYEGKVVGQCSIGLVRRYARYRHRAEVAFVILKQYCNLGIGGKMMQECINWCKEKKVSQIELDVVQENEHAINMYKGFGFKIVGTIPKALHYAEDVFADEYCMILDI